MVHQETLAHDPSFLDDFAEFFEAEFARDAAKIMDPRATAAVTEATSTQEPTVITLDDNYEEPDKNNKAPPLSPLQAPSHHAAITEIETGSEPPAAGYFTASSSPTPAPETPGQAALPDPGQGQTYDPTQTGYAIPLEMSLAQYSLVDSLFSKVERVESEKKFQEHYAARLRVDLRNSYAQNRFLNGRMNNIKLLMSQVIAEQSQKLMEQINRQVVDKFLDIEVVSLSQNQTGLALKTMVKTLQGQIQANLDNTYDLRRQLEEGMRAIVEKLEKLDEKWEQRAQKKSQRTQADSRPGPLDRKLEVRLDKLRVSNPDRKPPAKRERSEARPAIQSDSDPVSTTSTIISVPEPEAHGSSTMPQPSKRGRKSGKRQQSKSSDRALRSTDKLMLKRLC